VALEQIERRVGIVERVELAVGLVDDHADVARHTLDERGHGLGGQRGRRGVVGVADDDQARGRGDLLRHGIEVVLVAVVERHGDGGGAGGGRQVRVDAERRPRVDQLGARLEQRLAGGEQDVARSVADRDALDRDLVSVTQGPAQARVGGVRVAVEAPEYARDGFDHRGHRRVGRLVGGQQRDVLRQGVRAGGRVDGDAAHAL
jgi:hypothetical protein